jgi:hypothetical protein
MNEETAKTIVIGITALGTIGWLAGLAVMLRCTRERVTRAGEAAELFEVEGNIPENTIVGGADIAGQPEALATKLAERLAHNGLGFFGPVKIVACDRHEVAFEAAGPNLGGAAYGGTGFRRGRVRFTGSGTRTRVDYVVEISSRGRILLGLGWLALALGLMALIAAPWLEFAYVVPNANLRAQAVQTLQMVHFLWPPFLFAFLSRQPDRVLRAQMDALVNNIPYT